MPHVRQLSHAVCQPAECRQSASTHSEQGAVTELIKHCVSVTSSTEDFHVDLKL